MWNRENTTQVKASTTSKTDIKDSNNKQNKSKQQTKKMQYSIPKRLYICKFKLKTHLQQNDEKSTCLQSKEAQPFLVSPVEQAFSILSPSAS